MSLLLAVMLSSGSALALDAVEVARQVDAAAAATDQVVALLTLDANAALSRRVQRLTEQPNVTVTAISPLGDRQEEVTLALARVGAGCGFVLDPAPTVPSLLAAGACTPRVVTGENAEPGALPQVGAPPSTPAEPPLPRLYATVLGVHIFLGDEGGVSLGQDVHVRVSRRTAVGGGFQYVGMEGSSSLGAVVGAEVSPFGTVARGAHLGLGLGYRKESVDGFFGYDLSLFVVEARAGARYTIPTSPVYVAGGLGYALVQSPELDEPIHGSAVTFGVGLAY